MIEELVKLIGQKNLKYGIEIYPPATPSEITEFENKIGFPLPNDFKEFYSICNGFWCNDDIFNIVPLSKITEYSSDYGKNWFYFSEYMICSDLWGLRLNDLGNYEIFNFGYPNVVMSSSLIEFLQRFLQGGVFETGGLYDWQSELGMKGN